MYPLFLLRPAKCSDVSHELLNALLMQCLLSDAVGITHPVQLCFLRGAQLVWTPTRPNTKCQAFENCLDLALDPISEDGFGALGSLVAAQAWRPAFSFEDLKSSKHAAAQNIWALGGFVDLILRRRRRKPHRNPNNQMLKVAKFKNTIASKTNTQCSIIPLP